MSEWALVWIVPIRIAIVLVFALLYVIGGRKGKWVRRFVGGVFLPAAVIGLSLALGSFHWWSVFALAAYPLALCLGYGGDSTGEKLTKRLIYGLALGGCSFLFGSWVMGLTQTFLAVGLNLVLGIVNPVPAVNEEGAIASGSTFLVPFMV